jgi:ribosomal protein S18 acetylase RimI-like enzyme
MSGGIFCEPAGEADADLLLEMVRAFHQEEGRVFGTAGAAAVAAIAGGEPLARAWIARRGDHVLGYVVITLGYSIEYGGRDGFIDDLYVVPGEREQGVGRALLRFAVARAMELGIGTLHLEVEAGNETAHRLYRSAGFEATGRRLMRLRLPS